MAGAPAESGFAAIVRASHDQAAGYDFGKFIANDSVAMALRAKQLDTWTAEFLAEHGSATVLHLGCGLDSRVFRVDPPGAVRWYDLDHPEVIELRRRLFPARDGYHLMGCSVTDQDALGDVPADRPVVVIAEGAAVLPHQR